VHMWKHSYFGPPGKVVERRNMREAGATFVRFANGVTLVAKHTDFGRDQVIATVDFGYGQLELPRDRVAASDFGSDCSRSAACRTSICARSVRPCWATT
jgi:hypothetical protein